MDVVRLIEEVKEEANVTLTNEEVFMATQFKDFAKTLVIFSRGGGGKKIQVYDTIRLHVNKMDISFPSQLYIDGEFVDGEWGKMNARDRGALINKLADLMEEHQEELATIESIDSGAVYTLALKTHIGMSIATWRYFAGWCDKIEGSTIPINNARPNKNLTITRRMPLGVCGLITPWNYPLMMLSWKMAACLAAGNTA